MNLYGDQTLYPHQVPEVMSPYGNNQVYQSQQVEATAPTYKNDAYQMIGYQDNSKSYGQPVNQVYSHPIQKGVGSQESQEPVKKGCGCSEEEEEREVKYDFDKRMGGLSRLGLHEHPVDPECSTVRQKNCPYDKMGSHFCACDNLSGACHCNPLMFTDCQIRR